MSVDIGWLDLVIGLVVLVSALYAVWRGFVSETLSIVSWAAGAFATLYFGPWFARFVRTLMGPEWLADVVGYGLIFIAVVIPLSFVSHRVSEAVRHSPISPLDRALGGAFGVARGLAIVGIAYILFSLITPVPDQPDWVKQAALMPVVQNSADVLLSLVPDQDMQIQPFNPGASRAGDPIAAKIEETSGNSSSSQAVSAASGPSAGSNAASQKNGESSYGAEDRQALDRLIEATGNSGK